jgi:hypothetical protein
MGVHIFDTPFRACALKEPLWVKTTCRKPTGFGHPTKNTVEYEFQGTEFTTKTMLWTWFDGKGAPPKDHPDLQLPGDWKVPNQGAMFIGEDGMKMLLPHVGAPRLFPEEKFKGYKYPKLPNLDHYHQWIDASMGKTKCSADFTYAGRLTEALLLGIVANRYPNTKLEWDAKALKVTNISEANGLIRRKYREGFGAENL